MMSDYKVTLADDNPADIYVVFHGPSESVPPMRAQPNSPWPTRRRRAEVCMHACARAGAYAGGTWNVHVELPEGCATSRAPPPSACPSADARACDEFRRGHVRAAEHPPRHRAAGIRTSRRASASATGSSTPTSTRCPAPSASTSSIRRGALCSVRRAASAGAARRRPMR